MLENRKEQRQERQLEMLQRRCGELSGEIQRLKAEKVSLEAELESCHEKMAKYDEAYEAFTRSTQEARDVRDAYLQAYDQLQVIRRGYTAEMEKLISAARR